MATSVNQLFDQIHSIPQVPEVVQELILQVNNPDIDMGVIAQNVEREPTISLKILRLVNSAHYGLSRKVSSIKEALAFLGMSELKTLIIASGIVSSIPDIKDFDIKQFWERSFNTASYAKNIAIEAHQDPDIAFTAGLICNIGTILIHLGDPSAAMEIIEHVKAGHASQSEFEKRRLGYTSAEVTAEICRRWKLPDELISAVADCVDPLNEPEPSKIACILHIGRYLSTFKTGSQEEDIIAKFPFPVAEKISLTKAVLAEKLPKLLAIESNMSALVN